MASSATKALVGMPVLPLLLRHGGPATGRLVAVDRDVAQPGVVGDRMAGEALSGPADALKSS